jgi:hypothetical protein
MLQRKHVGDLSQRRRTIPLWLGLVLGFLAGTVLVLVVGASRDVTTALIGLLGVLLGGAVSATANFVLAREGVRAQITAATWSKRLNAHQEAYFWWQKCWRAVWKDEVRQELFTEADEWYLHNCLYYLARQEMLFIR